MTLGQKFVSFLRPVAVFIVCYAAAFIICLMLGNEIVELIYRHEMGFSLHEKLGRDLGLGLYEVFGVVPELIAGLLVGTMLTGYVFNKIADRDERNAEKAAPL